DAMDSGEVEVIDAVELSCEPMPCSGCPIAPMVVDGLAKYQRYCEGLGSSHMKHSVNTRRQDAVRRQIGEKEAAATDFGIDRLICEGIMRRVIAYTTQNPDYVRNAAAGVAGRLRNWLGVPETTSVIVIEDNCQNASGSTVMVAGLVGPVR